MFSSIVSSALLFILLNVSFLVEPKYQTDGGCLVKPADWDDSQVPLYEVPLQAFNFSLPESFDARTAWPECSDVINSIGEQARCGSCWAFAVAHTISDRICIASRGQLKPSISPQDLMECTAMGQYSGSNKEVIGRACAGGWPASAWAHYVRKGVVTGSTNASISGCKPYLFSCSIRDNQQYCPLVKHLKLSCLKHCHNSRYKLKYTEDRHFGAASSRLRLGEGDESILKMIIASQGPVTADIDGYALKQGNINCEGIFVGKGSRLNHAIRIIGWGTSEKVGGYWIIANSWGDTWNGDGTAKVAFGAARIGREVTFGIPKL